MLLNMLDIITDWYLCSTSRKPHLVFLHKMWFNFGEFEQSKQGVQNEEKTYGDS